MELKHGFRALLHGLGPSGSLVSRLDKAAKNASPLIPCQRGSCGRREMGLFSVFGMVQKFSELSGHETRASPAVEELGAAVGWSQPARQSWLCLEDRLVQFLLSFSSRCQSFPTGCGKYSACPETSGLF